MKVNKAPREIVLGNGNLCVALDSMMRIRDILFPLVGLENHAGGHLFRTGLQVDSKFTWVGDNWNISMKYLPETLVSKCIAVNPPLGIELEINDAVCNGMDVYLRKMTIRNLAEKKREVKVFLSQDFHIYGEDSGDTAFYDPILQSIIHYKRKRYFLANGSTDQRKGIHEFATGQKESFDKEGTWKDAEDGVLSGNPIAQGSVDSAVSFKLEIEPRNSSLLRYWIACGDSLEKVKELNAAVIKAGIEQLLLENENYWSAWVGKQELNLSIVPKDIARLFKASLMIMRTQIDNRGAIIASCDSDGLQFNRDTYAYMWPRDAAICAMAFDMAGYQEVAQLFFEFCNQVISGEGYFMHKYWSDGSVGSSWHPRINEQGEMQLPIQLDETALVMDALWKHFKKYRNLEFISKVYSRLVAKPGEFMQDYVQSSNGLPRSSFDMWEEEAGVFTSTSCTVCSALSAAGKFARVFYDSERQGSLNDSALSMQKAIRLHLYDEKLHRFIKGISQNGKRNTTIDSSLAFTFLSGTFEADSLEVKETMKEIFKHLWVDPGVGGLARYDSDKYHRVSGNERGNPWFICTLWLARWYIKVASSLSNLRKGLDILSWVAKYALPSGVLAEQLNPYDASPISVSPLVWSHAEFVIAVCEYIEKYNQLAI